MDAAFALGLVSGAHCAGMCGGIVTAFSSRQPLQPLALRLTPGWSLAQSYAAGAVWAWLSARAFRLAAAGLVLAFGVWGLARAAAISETVRTAILCL